MGLDVVEFKRAGLVVQRPAKDGGGEMTLLKEFDYEFMRGERIGIVGRNGAGKTTFLKTLVGEQPLTSGECMVGETVRYGYYGQLGFHTKSFRTYHHHQRQQHQHQHCYRCCRRRRRQYHQ